MDTPIADRKRLCDLRKWVCYLNSKDGGKRSYRWIASRTWRGVESQGYWERLAKGAHLEKKPKFRPREQDWHDLRILYYTVKDYNTNHAALFDKTLAVIGKRAELDGAVADLLMFVRRMIGETA